jgi:hypothetical protein
VTDARIARKWAVAMMGDEYFEHINPEAFKRLRASRHRKQLIGMIEERMKEAKQSLRDKVYADLFDCNPFDKTLPRPLGGLQSVVNIPKSYHGNIRTTV